MPPRAAERVRGALGLWDRSSRLQSTVKSDESVPPLQSALALASAFQQGEFTTLGVVLEARAEALASSEKFFLCSLVLSQTGGCVPPGAPSSRLSGQLNWLFPETLLTGQIYVSRFDKKVSLCFYLKTTNHV